MTCTPEQAQARLDAAMLSPEETRMVLLFLCGWAPDGVSSAVASIIRSRRMPPEPHAR